jgi:hypothetical protein
MKNILTTIALLVSCATPSSRNVEPSPVNMESCLKAVQAENFGKLFGPNALYVYSAGPMPSHVRFGQSSDKLHIHLVRIDALPASIRLIIQTAEPQNLWPRAAFECIVNGDGGPAILRKI